MACSKFTEIGDIVVVNTIRPSKAAHMRCYNTYYGVVVGFTINNNARVTPIYFNYMGTHSKGKITKYGPVHSAGRVLIARANVCLNAFPIANKEEFLNLGEYRKNYDEIINHINYEKHSKTLQPGKEKKVNLGLQLL